MDFNKKRFGVNDFFMTKFNYCPLRWMCHNRTYKKKTNRLRERCLQLIYNDKRSSFEDLQALAIEIFKVHTKTCKI